MIRFFKKPYRWAIVFGLCLTAAFVYVLLDAFVIPRRQAQVATMPPATATPSTAAATASAAAATAAVTPEPTPAAEPEPLVTDASYVDGSISISIETLRVHDTNIYIADVQMTDPSLLKTAFAQDAYGLYLSFR